MLIYIHGFLSSSQSSKAQQLKQWLTDNGRGDEFLCPDLSPHPVQAMATLAEMVEQAIKQAKENNLPLPKLIGSSLGGFYTTCLSEKYGLKAVVINPAINPAVTLAKRIGTHKPYYSEELIEFTHDDVQALQAMRYETVSTPNNFLLMVEKADETLDYNEAVEYFAESNQVIFNDGDHGFSRFSQVLELIDRF